MNNKRQSKVADTFMEEEMEQCKIFGKFESMTKKRSSEILADEKTIFGVKIKRKSVISENSENEIFLESLTPPSQILAYATDVVKLQFSSFYYYEISKRLFPPGFPL